VISDALIERRFLQESGGVYSQLFCHNGSYKEEVFDGKSHDEDIICYPLIEYQMLPLCFKKRSICEPDGAPWASDRPVHHCLLTAQSSGHSIRPASFSPEEVSWGDLERNYVLQLLEKNKWNISKSARHAGLKR